MNKKISIGFIGDFCLSQDKNKSPNYQLEALEFCKMLNNKVDLAVANHEFNVLEREEDVKWMAVSVDNIPPIENGGFDVFCLANNHIGDYGDTAMMHTRAVLNNSGHHTVGIGNTEQEAYEPLYIERNDYRIAILNYSDATQYAAGKNKPGLAKVHKSQIKKAIVKAKKAADIVILQIHADLEFTNYPAPWRVRLSRELAKLGPDLIIQHHPHCLQGIEMVGNTLIAYSLGNFIFPAYGNSYGENRPGNCEESVYMTVTINDNEDGSRSINYELTPIVINENNVSYIPAAEKSDEIIEKMAKYSEALKNGPKLRKHFFNMCKNQMRTLLYNTYYRTAKSGPIEGFKYFASHFETAAHTNWIRGFFTFGKY